MSTTPPPNFIVPQGTPLPPPRPGVRHLRLPRLGIVVADDELRDRVDRLFHWPMIILALAILPLLLVEFVKRPEGWLAWALRIGFGIIWTAFLVEFLVKISIAESRLEYVRRNWLDLVIIAVPLLRPLRVYSSVGRTTRVFKLRGVGMKLLRYVVTFIIGMEATERFLRRLGLKRAAGHREPERMTRHELIDEVKRLRHENEAWARWSEEEQRFVAEHLEGAAFQDPPPSAEADTGEADEAAERRADDGSNPPAGYEARTG